MACKIYHAMFFRSARKRALAMDNNNKNDTDAEMYITLHLDIYCILHMLL